MEKEQQQQKPQRGTVKFSPLRLAASGGSKGGVVREAVSTLQKEAT